MKLLSFEGYQFSDYDPVTFEAKERQRVDVTFRIEGDCLTLMLGSPVNQVVFLAAPTKTIARLVRELE